jgi:mRNA interferase YafQ
VRTPSSTRRFRKDVERVGRRGKDLPKLREAIDLLCAGQPLPAKYRDHALLGDLKGFRDCHLEPDWLLIYAISDDGQSVSLVRTGTHADLFG